jgi:2-C-methyl-D-erythritol 4-phosphate cytidylyltransferase
MTVAAIIAAAGSGTRMGVDTPKQFLELMERPIVAWSLDAFSRAREVTEMILVAHPAYMDLCSEAAKRYSRGVTVKVVPGGHTRQESVLNGIREVSQSIEWVAVHDAARPFITPSQIDSTCLMAMEIGAAIAGAPMVDTVKEVEANIITRTLDRTHLVAAQTPQVCRKDDLLRAEVARLRDKIYLPYVK